MAVGVDDADAKPKPEAFDWCCTPSYFDRRPRLVIHIFLGHQFRLYRRKADAQTSFSITRHWIDQFFVSTRKEALVVNGLFNVPIGAFGHCRLALCNDARHALRTFGTSRIDNDLKIVAQLRSFSHHDGAQICR